MVVTNLMVRKNLWVCGRNARRLGKTDGDLLNLDFSNKVTTWLIAQRRTFLDRVVDNFGGLWCYLAKRG